MTEDWTVDIPLRTPSGREASKDEVTTKGKVLGRPAELTTHGTSIRLKVTGFASKEEAELACPRLCFGLRYMSLQVPIAIRLELYPQKVAFCPDPVEGAKNVSRSFGGTDFGDEVHGIMQDGAPAIYPTGNKILMFTGGEVTMTISGLGKPSDAMRWIAEGAASAAATTEIDDTLATAIELFNLAGFEPSPRAAFIVHCTALEQLFPPEEVDPLTADHIARIGEELGQKAGNASTEEERQLLDRLRQRVQFLKRDSTARAVQNGVSRMLSDDDDGRAEALATEVRDIFKVRHTLAHRGSADLGDAPRRLLDLLKQVLLRKLQRA
jgi:hypothetical protein